MLNYEAIVFTYRGEEYRYTTSRRVVQLLGKVLKPLAISRSAVVRSENDARDLEIEVPTDNEVASLYKNRTPDETVYCQVMRVHKGEPLVYFTGYISGVNFRAEQGDAPRAIIMCTNDMQRLSRGGLGYTFTTTCNHDVYGKGCGLDFDAMAITGIVSDITGGGFRVHAPELAGFGNDHFRAGLFRIGGVNRMITEYNPTEGWVELFSPITGLAVGDTFKAAQGCNRSFQNCKQLNNTGNFMGFPWLPGDEIWQSGTMRQKDIN